MRDMRTALFGFITYVGNASVRGFCEGPVGVFLEPETGKTIVFPVAQNEVLEDIGHFEALERALAASATSAASGEETV